MCPLPVRSVSTGCRGRSQRPSLLGGEQLLEEVCFDFVGLSWEDPESLDHVSSEHDVGVSNRMVCSLDGCEFLDLVGESSDALLAGFDVVIGCLFAELPVCGVDKGDFGVLLACVLCRSGRFRRVAEGDRSVLRCSVDSVDECACLQFGLSGCSLLPVKGTTQFFVLGRKIEVCELSVAHRCVLHDCTESSVIWYPHERSTLPIAAEV